MDDLYTEITEAFGRWAEIVQQCNSRLAKFNYSLEDQCYCKGLIKELSTQHTPLWDRLINCGLENNDAYERAWMTLDYYETEIIRLNDLVTGLRRESAAESLSKELLEERIH